MEQGDVERVGCEGVWHVRKQLEQQSCLFCNERTTPSSFRPALQETHVCRVRAWRSQGHGTSMNPPSLHFSSYWYTTCSFSVCCELLTCAYSTLQQVLHDKAAFWSSHTKEHIRVDQMNSLGGSINCTVESGTVHNTLSVDVSSENKAKLLISFHTDSSKAELGLWIINIT